MVVRYFVGRLLVWFVASICKVEGYIKKVDNFFVGIDCDL